MANIFEWNPNQTATGKGVSVATITDTDTGIVEGVSMGCDRISTKTAVNRDGILYSTLSKEPAMTLKDGVLVASLEGESTNTVENSRPSSTEYIDNNISYNVVDIPFFGGITNVVSYADNLLDRRRYFGTSVNGVNYTISCYVIMNDLGEPFIGSGSSNDFELWIGKEANITSFKEKQAGDNNIWRVWGYGEGVSDSVTNGVRKRDTNSDRGFIMTQLDIIEGNTPSSPIYTNGSAATRFADTGFKTPDISSLINLNSENLKLTFDVSFLNNDLADSLIGLTDQNSENYILIGNEIIDAGEKRIRLLIKSNNTTVVDEVIKLGIVDTSDRNTYTVEISNNTSYVFKIGSTELSSGTMTSSPVGLSYVRLFLANNSFSFKGNVYNLKIES